MSLINQMLRDLQQRHNNPQAGRPGSRPPRSVPRRAVPPLLWVFAGALAGLAGLWGLSGWLWGGIGPVATTPVPRPSVEMVTVADPPALASPPPLASVTSESEQAVPSAVETPAAASLPEPAEPAVEPKAHTRARLIVTTSSFPVIPAAADRSAAVTPASPSRLHPELLPGAVNPTSLALREASRGPVTPATPYGQAEAAYREGREDYAANRTEESMAALQRCLQDYPGHLPARELLVDQLELAGRIEEAYALLRQGVAIAPDYTPFRKRAARMLLDRGAAGAAVDALIGGGLPRVDDDPELHRLLADGYLTLGENFLAAQTYRNLVAHDPGTGADWLGLGDALAADGQAEEARRAYRKALAAGGLSGEARARLQAQLDSR